MPLGESEDALIAAGEGDRVGPGEVRSGCGLESGQLGGGCQRSQAAGGGDEFCCGSDSLVHTVDSAECNAIECLGQGFGAAGVDAGGDAGDADSLLEEGGFFVLGFSESDGDLGAADRDGDAGKTGSRAVVEEGGDDGGKGLGTGDGLEEVAIKDLAGIADRGEIGAGIPAEKKREVITKSFILLYLKRFKTRRCNPFLESGHEVKGQVFERAGLVG